MLYVNSERMILKLSNKKKTDYNKQSAVILLNKSYFHSI